jgi:hypothetical protein
MKNITFYLAIIFLTLGYTVKAQTEAQKVEMCSRIAGPEATYVKDIIVDLPAAQGNEKIPSSKNTFIMRKDNKYRVTICTDDDSPGKGYVQLFDNQTMLGSSYNATTGKEFKSFDFDCQKTGAYHFIIQFLEGKAGKAVVIVSFLKKL